MKIRRRYTRGSRELLWTTEEAEAATCSDCGGYQPMVVQNPANPALLLNLLAAEPFTHTFCQREPVGSVQ